MVVQRRTKARGIRCAGGFALLDHNAFKLRVECFPCTRKLAIMPSVRGGARPPGSSSSSAVVTMATTIAGRGGSFPTGFNVRHRSTKPLRDTATGRQLDRVVCDGGAGAAERVDEPERDHARKRGGRRVDHEACTTAVARGKLV